MQMHITSQQIRTYAQFGWIEFEEFLSPEQCAAALNEIQTLLLRRGHHRHLPLESTYQAGRDLWRQSQPLQQLLVSRHLSAAAATLSGKQPLQLACDQWIPENYPLSPLNMQAHLSFQGLVCGCLLSFEGELAGRARFCQPDRLPRFEKSSQLLIAYGSLQTIYIHNSADPCNPQLKGLGYQFGDRLLPKTHPLC